MTEWCSFIKNNFQHQFLMPLLLDMFMVSSETNTVIWQYILLQYTMVIVLECMHTNIIFNFYSQHHFMSIISSQLFYKLQGIVKIFFKSVTCVYMSCVCVSLCVCVCMWRGRDLLISNSADKNG